MLLKFSASWRESGVCTHKLATGAGRNVACGRFGGELDEIWHRTAEVVLRARRGIVLGEKAEAEVGR